MFFCYTVSVTSGVVPINDNKTYQGSVSLCELASKVLSERKAEDIVVIPLENKSTIADYMIVASGTSQRHLQSLATWLEQELKRVGASSIHVEGKAISDWILVDAGDVVIHLFKPDVRAMYNLEKMWQADFELESRGA